MKKLLIVLVAFLGFAMPASAASFGVKFIGVQYNTFDPGQGTGLQVELGTFFFSTDLELNYLLGRIPLDTAGQFSLYYGAGAHVGFLGFFGFGGALGFGAHGVVGVDYLLQPGLAIGASFKPGLSYYLNNVGLLFYPGGSFYVQFKI
jgi:hypothetical protein